MPYLGCTCTIKINVKTVSDKEWDVGWQPISNPSAQKVETKDLYSKLASCITKLVSSEFRERLSASVEIE